MVCWRASLPSVGQLVRTRVLPGAARLDVRRPFAAWPCGPGQVPGTPRAVADRREEPGRFSPGGRTGGAGAAPPRFACWPRPSRWCVRCRGRAGPAEDGPSRPQCRGRARRAPRQRRALDLVEVNSAEARRRGPLPRRFPWSRRPPRRRPRRAGYADRAVWRSRSDEPR